MSVDKSIFNGLSDKVAFARDEISYSEFMQRNELNKSNYRAAVTEHLKPALKTLSEKYEQYVNEFEQLGTKYKRLRTELEQIKTDSKHSGTLSEQLRTENEQLRNENRTLGTENKQLQKETEQQKQELEQLRSYYERHNGRDGFIKTIGGYAAENALLLLMAGFGVAGSFHLLSPIDTVLAVVVCVPLGLMLLHFTAKGEFWSKIFCILFEMVVIGIFFDVFPQSWTKYVFTFAPTAMVALIAFGNRLKKLEK